VFLISVPVPSVSAMEGESVTLNFDITEIKDYKWIEWRFEDDDKIETVIAEIDVTADRIVYLGRFKDKLKLNNQTGSLTITNITTEHAGEYKQYAGKTESIWSSATILLAVIGWLNICFTVLCFDQTKQN